MKAALILVLVAVVGIGLAWKYGGLADFDPAGQADELKQIVKPGMTWKQVVAIRKPRKVHPANPESLSGKGAAVDYTEQWMAKVVKDQSLAMGFCYEYSFADSLIIEVWFDAAGVVEDVQEISGRSLLGGAAP